MSIKSGVPARSKYRRAEEAQFVAAFFPTHLIFSTKSVHHCCSIYHRVINKNYHRVINKNYQQWAEKLQFVGIFSTFPLFDSYIFHYIGTPLYLSVVLVFAVSNGNIQKAHFQICTLLLCYLYR